MKTTEDKIKEIENNGYFLNLDSLITRTFDNYKKIAVTAGLGLLVITVILAVVVLGVIEISVGLESFNKGLANLNITYISGPALVIYLMAVVIISVFTAPMIAGIFKLAHHAETNKTHSFSLLFSYYKNRYFKEIMLVTIIITTFNFCLTSLIETSGVPILGAILSYFIQICTSLALPLIIFGNLTAVKAIKGSFTIVTKQFGIVFLLVIISGLLAMTGLIVFCIGIFFTLPIIYSAQYMIYTDTIGFDEMNIEIDNI